MHGAVPLAIIVAISYFSRGGGGGGDGRGERGEKKTSLSQRYYNSLSCELGGSYIQAYVHVVVTGRKRTLYSTLISGLIR